jgi:hypothetical protein
LSLSRLRKKLISLSFTRSKTPNSGEADEAAEVDERAGKGEADPR